MGTPTTQFSGDPGELAFHSILRRSQARLCRSGHCCRCPHHSGLHREHPRGNALPLWQNERGQGLVGVHLRDHQDAPRSNVWPLSSETEDSSGETHIPNPRLSFLSKPSVILQTWDLLRHESRGDGQFDVKCSSRNDRPTSTTAGQRQTGALVS